MFNFAQRGQSENTDNPPILDVGNPGVVWVYGFSTTPMDGVAAEEHDRFGVWAWRALIGQTYEAMERVPMMFFRCR
jgi:hypothetical protein